MMVWANLLAAGFAVTALGGVGTGIGILFAAFLISFAYSPTLEKNLFNYSLVAFALVEAMGLFTLMMAFLVLYTELSTGSVVEFPSTTLTHENVNLSNESDLQNDE